MENYKITLLKGDGIGPEIVNQAVKVLDKAAEKFNFTVEYDEALLAAGSQRPVGRRGTSSPTGEKYSHLCQRGRQPPHL